MKYVDVDAMHNALYADEIVPNTGFLFLFESLKASVEALEEIAEVDGVVIIPLNAKAKQEAAKKCLNLIRDTFESLMTDDL